MTTIAFLRHSTRCPKCGEDAFTPECAEFVSVAEVHHFWCCWQCGDEFETRERLHVGGTPPSELIRKSVSNVLVA